MQLPTTKTDVGIAEALADHPVDELSPHLAELLQWMKDFNWPVAKVIAPILAGSDKRIVPHLVEILQGQDNIWKFWVLSEVGIHLDKHVRDQPSFAEEVLRIINDPTPGEQEEEVHLAARNFMILWSHDA